MMPTEHSRPLSSQRIKPRETTGGQTPTMRAYVIWASAVSAWLRLRGDRPREPGYIANAKKRVRRSLFNLSESFTYGWSEVAAGRFSNALIVYAATIGEFHPLKPVVDCYLDRHPNVLLVVLCGQRQYCDAVHTAYPRAVVGIPPPGAPWLYDKLFRLTRPCLVVIGEGPCLHGHFPIPLELALPATCLRHSTTMIVVNATMFPYQPASRLDRIEGALFGSLYREAIRCWYTQNEIFQSWLIRAGVPPARIVVTGDLRFDAQRALGERSDDLNRLLTALAKASGPFIVAGSVNAIDEQGPVIEGWLKVRARHRGARLIIAPRHVNNPENMGRLYDLLQAKEIRFARRSEGTEASLAADAIVVDVFGELPHYYSIAAVAYIGRNHTVLEPLRFEVPTVVAPRRDWAANYVTFPAYMELVEARGIIEADDKSELGRIFLKVIDSREYGQSYVSRALALAERQKGAGNRIVEHLEFLRAD